MFITNDFEDVDEVKVVAVVDIDINIAVEVGGVFNAISI